MKRNKQNTKWQRQKPLYKGPYLVLRRGLQAFLAIFFVGCLVAGYLFFKNSDNFKVTSVEVSGEFSHLTEDEVIVLSRLKRGQHLFGIDFQTVRDNILSFPWIANVKLKRKFPDTVQIYIKERKLSALLFAENLYLVDDKGKIFKKLKSEDITDLPIITGFEKDHLLKYPLLMQEYLDDCFAKLKYLQKQNAYQKDSISEIHYDSIFGITIYTKEQGLEIYYGKNNIESKHQKLEKFFASSDFHKTAFVRLDLDSPGKIIARKF